MGQFKNFYMNSCHMVSSSPWPFVTSLISFVMTGGLILWWKKFLMKFPFFGFVLIMMLMFLWWGDVSFENSQGDHSLKVQSFIRSGMILFIMSEVLFFFSFFWAFFHKCLSTTLEIGKCWPPFNFYSIMIDPFSMPLLKTMILLSSGVTMTSSHHFLLTGFYNFSSLMLFFTLLLGFFFLFLQMFEYSNSMLGIKSSFYGSSFFMLTGFHGLHVFMGGMMIGVSLIRLLLNKYSNSVHLVFELSAWYWHFVDVVWLFLFFFLYWFGFTLTKL